MKVGHLEERYQEWAHQPIVSKEGPRFFANDTMEVMHLVFYTTADFVTDLLYAFFLTNLYAKFECPVVNTHEMVGRASHLASCCLLVVSQVHPDGSCH